MGKRAGEKILDDILKRYEEGDELLKKFNSLTSEKEKRAFIEDFLKKEREDMAVKKSKRLREEAYDQLSFAIVPSPVYVAISRVYPHVSDGVIATFLTLGFNYAVNKSREKEFEERDRQEFRKTGTTDALRIAED